MLEIVAIVVSPRDVFPVAQPPIVDEHFDSKPGSCQQMGQIEFVTDTGQITPNGIEHDGARLAVRIVDASDLLVQTGAVPQAMQRPRYERQEARESSFSHAAQ